MPMTPKMLNRLSSNGQEILLEIMNAEELKQLIEQCKQVGTRYEELFSFVCGLRRADFKISTPQLIAVQKLIVALARSGENPVDFARLKTFIAPLVCSSPEEQTAFYHHFDQWLETHQPPVLTEVAAAIPHEQPPAPTNSASEKEVSQSWWQTRAFKAAISLTGLLIVAALFFYYSPEQKTFAGIVRDKETKKPLGNAQISFGEKIYQSNESGQFSFTYHSFTSNSQPLTVSLSGYQSLKTTIEANQNRGEFILTPEKIAPPIATTFPVTLPDTTQTTAPPSFYEKYYPEILIAAALLPFVIYGIWLLWRWLRRKQLERWREENQPDFRSLTLKDNGNFLYGNPTFRRTAQELRRHRRLETNALDVAFTVEATVREGGLFKAVYAKRQVSPEYLVLIDQLGYRDHKSRLEDKILDRFEREGIFFECYYFNRDPRLCRPKIVSRKGKQPKYLNLRELSTQYPEHRLLIFSDGAGMVDKFSGRPFRWTRSLSEWEIRALLTPNSALEYDEWILEQEAGLPVLPAHEKDLKTLVEIIRTGELPKIKSYAENTNYPRTLTEDFEQWWLRHVRPRVLEDDNDIAEILRIELRYYLGADGYFLLCACAVYPELAPDLTFYLAHRFIAPDRREIVLESLVCLPWFRQALMPDWIREDLLADLTFEQETEVREVIESLLSNYIENPKQGFNLQIATQKNEDDIGFWKRRKLHEIIKTEPETSPLRDYVFLKFVSTNKLAVALPRKLARFLEKQTATRFAFLRHFYGSCANAVKSIGNLWQTPINGISRLKSLMIPAFLSLVAVGILLLFAPTYPINPDDVTPNQEDTSEDNILSKLINDIFATPKPISSLTPFNFNKSIPSPTPTIVIIKGLGNTFPNTVPNVISPNSNILPKTNAVKLIVYVNEAESGMRIRDVLVKFESDKLPGLRIDSAPGVANIELEPGTYTLTTSASGYITRTEPVTIDSSTTEIIITLDAEPLPTTPTPTSSVNDSPTPIPPLTITSVMIIYETKNNPKEADTSVQTVLKLNGQDIGSIANGTGSGQFWEKGNTTGPLSINLNAPILYEQCENLQVWVNKTPKDQWDVSFSVDARLNTGRLIGLIPPTRTYKLGDNDNFNWVFEKVTCPSLATTR